jgi:hypothetical protein
MIESVFFEPSRHHQNDCGGVAVSVCKRDFTCLWHNCHIGVDANRAIGKAAVGGKRVLGRRATSRKAQIRIWNKSLWVVACQLTTIPITAAP